MRGDGIFRHHTGDECPGGHRSANLAGVDWDDQETAEEANARGATVEDVTTRLISLGLRVKAPWPCTDPWCRDTPTCCGRTPQEHLEDGLTPEKFFAANPPAPEA